MLAFEEDIKERSFIEWLEAHTSGFKPLHRYEGTFEIKSDKIVFDGIDKKGIKDLHLEIMINDIIDVYYGFDDIFKGREERSWPWNKPLRITFHYKNKVRKTYLFVNFHHKMGIRTSDNEKVYEILSELVERE